MQLAVEPGVGARVKAQAQHEKDAEFEAYMAARQPGLLRTAYLISGDRHTAEDLVQTALAKLYLSWDRVHDRQVLDGYVRRIIVNEHHSLWRRAWKKRELTTDSLPDHQTVAHDHDHEQRDALWEFVQTLPRKQRAVIVLRYYEDLSEAEIAETLGISVGTVKSQASRALAAMRSRVHDHPVLAQDATHATEEER